MLLKSENSCLSNNFTIAYITLIFYRTGRIGIKEGDNPE
jgi:hypothetical protein